MFVQVRVHMLLSHSKVQGAPGIQGVGVFLMTVISVQQL